MGLNWYKRAQLSDSGDPIAVNIIAGLSAIATNSGPVEQYLESMPMGQEEQVNAAIEQAQQSFLNSNAFGQTSLTPEQMQFLEEVKLRAGGGLDYGSQPTNEPLPQVPAS